MERHEIPDHVRWYIIGQDTLGLYQSAIVNLVWENFHIATTQSAISKIISKYRTTGIVEGMPREGRPKKLSRETEIKILRVVKKDRTLNATQISRDQNLNPFGDFHVCARTLSRALNCHGLKDSTDIIQQIPPDAQTERFNFAVQCQKNNLDWRSIIFTDESDLFPDKQGKLHYRRYEGEMVDLDVGIETRWDPRKVKVWGSISYDGVGRLVKYTKTVKSDKYIEFLNDVLLEDFPGLRGTKTRRGKYLLQQDNARPHVSYDVKKYLEAQHVHCLVWPSYSPDLSPIENVWGFIKEELYKKNNELFTVDDTWEEIQRIWNFDVDPLLRKLYEDIPFRIQKVIDRQGKRIV